MALTQASVEGADGVSVSLQRHGRLTTVAATDQTILDMDARQYATGEGPCVDASVEGHWFHAESLDEETRWPTFTPKAQRLGINAILSNPLGAENGPVGALNIYSRTAAAFSPKEQALASTFASGASILLQVGGVDVSDERMSERIGAALRNRHTIAQAEGVVMERDGIRKKPPTVDAGHLATRQPAAGRTSGRRGGFHAAHTSGPSRSEGDGSMTDPLNDELDRARLDAGLTHGELWLRCFGLGGMSTALQVEAFCCGASVPAPTTMTWSPTPSTSALWSWVGTIPSRTRSTSGWAPDYRRRFGVRRTKAGGAALRPTRKTTG